MKPSLRETIEAAEPAEKGIGIGILPGGIL
jgi:hypothetical protein